MEVTAENILDGIGVANDVKDDGDFLGGYNPFESDLYDFTINAAYFTVSPGGAKCLNVTFVQDRRELKQQFYITSAKAKGCLPYYTNSKTGEKQYLPGYTLARHLAKLTASGKELNDLQIEERHVKIYNKEQKKEIPTKVLMCVEMLGKSVTCGVIKRMVDKNKDTGTIDAEGKKIYAPTGEFRTENEVVKIFRSRDRMTVTEIEARAEKAEFASKWLDKWFGQVEDKRTKNAGVAGGITSNSAPIPNPVVASLFN